MWQRLRDQRRVGPKQPNGLRSKTVGRAGARRMRVRLRIVGQRPLKQ
jgi:hypothetical protein